MDLPKPNPPSYSDQIASLESVLPFLDTAKAALPSLLRSVSQPASNSAERALVYRTASDHASQSIQLLSERLALVEGILTAAETSAQNDPNGIIVKPRQDKRNETDWSELERIMGAGNEMNGKRKRQRSRFVAYKNRFELPHDENGIKELLKAWKEANPNIITLELDANSITLVNKGLLKANIELAPESHPDESAPNVQKFLQPERVSVFGLKEEKPNYLQSQFSLFQEMTKTAMDAIEQGRLRRARTAANDSGLEELLDLLTDPPVPF